jgi:hypothetical protein
METELERASILQQKGKAALGGLFVIIFSVVSSPRSFLEDQTW